MAYYQPPNPYFSPTSVTAPASSAFPTQSNNSFVWVQGEEAAKAYPVAPNNRILFMDSERPALYAKSTDHTGKPTEWHVYDLVERTEQNSVPSSEVQNKGIPLDIGITKEELEAMVADAVRKELDARRQKKKQQKEVTADA